MSDFKKDLIYNNSSYIGKFILVIIIGLLIIEISIPYFLFPLYLGRIPNYNHSNDMILIVFLEILGIFFGIIGIVYFLQLPIKIIFSNKYLKLRNTFNQEKKYLLKNIKNIEKIDFNNSGFKYWTIIGIKSFKNERYGNKAPLFVSNNIGEQIKTHFNQLNNYEHID